MNNLVQDTICCKNEKKIIDFISISEVRVKSYVFLYILIDIVRLLSIQDEFIYIHNQNTLFLYSYL